MRTVSAGVAWGHGQLRVAQYFEPPSRWKDYKNEGTNLCFLITLKLRLPVAIGINEPLYTRTVRTVV
jgi:hypothetical protein